jgi:hypothetical protein
MNPVCRKCLRYGLITAFLVFECPLGHEECSEAIDHDHFHFEYIAGPPHLTVNAATTATATTLDLSTEL